MALLCAVCFFFPQDPPGSGHKRFHAAKEAYCLEDGPQSPWRSAELKELFRDFQSMVLSLPNSGKETAD